ncbi:MAG TPA: aspartate-semialdehyde dehydrogenase [Solirubrobacteraceae bacterium]|nr:aspartate-semialdehyde dehydrogenase [Solirubrobacteraceae bacterium]
MSADAPRVAVVGATGAVGTAMLEILAQRRFPAAEIVAFASERSVGRRLGELAVRSLEDDAIQGFDLALFSAGSTISREWAPRFVAAGATVVDNSSTWRMEADVPLVVAEVNPEALESHRGIVANPNCSVMQLVVALKPIADAVGLERVIVSTYQSTSGTGARAMDELRDQTHALLHESEPDAPRVYPHQIAFNVLPQVEIFGEGDDYTTEERKVMGEARKILADPGLRITATCARVPVLNCHAESVNVQTRDDLSPEECRSLLAAAPSVIVLDDPSRGIYPLPREAAGRDEVFVGRVRRDASAERTLHLWVVSDNLRKGAALNAVQLAELLLERSLLRVPAAA